MFSRIRGNKAFSGLLALGMGTIGAQLINLLVQPIITRLITPDELGLYTFIISVANVIIPIASLKLNMLIVVEEDDQKAHELTVVSLISVLLMATVSFFIVIILLLANYKPFVTIGLFIIFIPIIIVTNGIRFTMISHNNRLEKYSLIAKVDILREFVKGVFQVVLGLIGIGTFGQTLGYAISPLAGIKVQSKDFIEYIKKSKSIHYLNLTVRVIKENSKHILYLVPAQLINSFSYALITISIISLYSPKEAGYYSISVMVLGLPLVLVSNNVGRVFLKEFSNHYNNGKPIWGIFLKFTTILFLISSIGFIMLAALAPQFTQVIFGENYKQSGTYISILCLMYAFRLIASSVNGIYIVLQSQKMEIIFQILLVLSGIIVHLISYYLKLNVYEYLWLITSTYGFIYMLNLINMGYLSKKMGRNTN
ncbi:lipopolysaccharide biosynthesis protein [Rossellomorea marisflavi]|uniref:lipopolysaccharide biosynthesis protein n=1 Tax=Rossellomorea marisflavi TaxID=189381 RepID=UPI003D2F0980